MSDACRKLEAWLTENGVTWAKDAMAFRRGVAGMGVWSLRHIRAGEVLAEIPKSAVLSIRNTVLASVLAEQTLDLETKLRLAICAERKLSASRWRGYFESLVNGFEYLPHLWNDQQRALLRGTDAEQTVEETRRELAAEFRQLRPLLRRAAALAEVDITLEDYLQAASLASSRAFTVDDFHLEALVPLADAFNHRCQRVPAGEKVKEIQPGTCTVSTPDEGSDRAPFSLWRGKVPGMQIALAESVGKGARGTGPAGKLMAYVLTDIPADREIFNTYGEFSNDKLLQDYGFVLEHNAFNTVTLARAALESASRAAQLRFARAHCKQLGLLQGEADEEEEEEEEEEEDVDEMDAEDGSRGFISFFELPASGRLPRQLRVLLAVLASPRKELRTRPKPDVRGAWRPLLRRALRRRWAEYPETCEAAVDRERWRQMPAGLERDALGLRISEKEILEHFLQLARPLSRKRGGDFRFYMDSNAEMRKKIESHYTGIDGLIDSVPASRDERKKLERKGLRKNRGKRAAEERQQLISGNFLSSREWRLQRVEA
ncbi:unnamed protein product [Effrenium voratum]|uniref:SET domain-containing protein n=1 Tax=Effrenium voratum TaxID=2562239 RepID=A0AA36JSJ7_9DINO|nr:unnamed protein product [Effrenium voratum]